MRTSWLLLSIAVCVAAPSTARAQRVMAVELGPSLIGDGSLLQTGVRFSGITPNRATVDIAVATYLDAFASEAFVALTDVSAALPLALGPDVRLVPRAGVSGLLGASGTASVFAPGFHMGIGAIALLTPRSGLRLDYTLRHLTYEGETSSWNSLTLGFVFGT